MDLELTLDELIQLRRVERGLRMDERSELQSVVITSLLTRGLIVKTGLAVKITSDGFAALRVAQVDRR